MILDALSQPSLAPSAALAFRDLCGECAEMLVPVAVQLIPACQVGIRNYDCEHGSSCVCLGAPPPPPRNLLVLNYYMLILHPLHPLHQNLEMAKKNVLDSRGSWVFQFTKLCIFRQVYRTWSHVTRSDWWQPSGVSSRPCQSRTLLDLSKH